MIETASAPARHLTPMRVFVLGGTGRFGSAAARRLAASGIISEVAIAGRNQDLLARAVAELGEKAKPVHIDAVDGRVAHAAAGYDIVVNKAGLEWETLLPGLRGAIAAGAHYSDIGADGPTTARQLELGSMARERGILAVPGIGYDPGLTNLLAVHGSRQFDRLEELQICRHWGPALASSAAEELRATGRVSASMQVVMKGASGPVHISRHGQEIAIDPLAHGAEITLPEGGTVTAYPVGTPEPITLARTLPHVQGVSSLTAVSPLNSASCSSARPSGSRAGSAQSGTRRSLSWKHSPPTPTGG